MKSGPDGYGLTYNYDICGHLGSNDLRPEGGPLEFGLGSARAVAIRSRLQCVSLSRQSAPLRG